MSGGSIADDVRSTNLEMWRSLFRPASVADAVLRMVCTCTCMQVTTRVYPS